jgi:hypothetical protein
MTLYREKTEIVEAIQFDESKPDEVIAFLRCSRAAAYFINGAVCKSPENILGLPGRVLIIHAKDKEVKPRDGSWIIRHDDDSVDVLTKGQFEQTYEILGGA